jgi:hypothetical protein
MTTTLSLIPVINFLLLSATYILVVETSIRLLASFGRVFPQLFQKP